MGRRRTTPSDQSFTEDAAARETRRVLWIVLWLNLGVAAAKFGYGLLTGSVSMQADGIHSSFDGMSNVIGLFGLWAAAHPPNAQYPYGHKKYETFAAAGIGLLLFGTCLYILWNSYLHWRESVVPEVTGLSFGIMLGTMAVNWGVMTWEHRRGKILQSEILVADSLHTASDILSSLSVLIGLAAVSRAIRLWIRSPAWSLRGSSAARGCWCCGRRRSPSPTGLASMPTRSARSRSRWKACAAAMRSGPEGSRGMSSWTCASMWIRP